MHLLRCRRLTCGVHGKRQMFHSLHPSVEAQIASAPGLAVVVLCVPSEQQHQQPQAHLPEQDGGIPLHLA